MVLGAGGRSDSGTATHVKFYPRKLIPRIFTSMSAAGGQHWHQFGNGERVVRSSLQSALEFEFYVIHCRIS